MARAAGPRPRFVLLSSSLLVDRVFLHTDLVASLQSYGEVEIWATSKKNGRYAGTWEGVADAVREFPEIRPFREVPHNYLRRMNEYAWDYRFKLPSRMSMNRHVRDKHQELSVRAMKIPGWAVARCGLEKALEDRLERLMLAYPRSEEAEARFLKHQPAAVVATGPFQYEQPAVVSAAKNLGIPVLAYIPSWDNVTTKNRFVYKYDGYIVWSEETKKQLYEFYPASASAPVYTVGAPQFDVFRREEFLCTRSEFFAREGLNEDLPLIVYSLGSPNFLKEHHGALRLAERVAAGDLGDVQMLVRPHPMHDNDELANSFAGFGPRVVLQRTPNAGLNLNERSQDDTQIRRWINTFRHADVIVNLSSTVAIDGAIFDRPIVNLDFDPNPTGEQQELIKDINHRWNHFKPIAESGGVWLVNDLDELAEAVRTYLKKPELHREKRRWIAEYVCGYLDGKCGRRMAEAIADFASRAGSAREAPPDTGSKDVYGSANDARERS